MEKKFDREMGNILSDVVILEQRAKSFVTEFLQAQPNKKFEAILSGNVGEERLEKYEENFEDYTFMDDASCVQVSGRHENYVIAPYRIELTDTNRLLVSGIGCEEYNQDDWTNCDYYGSYITILECIKHIQEWNEMVEEILSEE